MSKNFIQIRKVLISTIGEEKSKPYVVGLNFVFVDSKDLYEKSLDALINGDTEKSLKYLIFGLDNDRGYTPLLNLCRTIMLGLSDILTDNDFDTYKHKYKSFKGGKISLLKKIDEIKSKRNNLKVSVNQIEEQIEKSKPSFFSFFKFSFLHKKNLKKLKPILEGYHADIKECNDEIEKVEQEIKHIEKLTSLDGYVKILNLIVEVCTVPIRFEWSLA